MWNSRAEISKIDYNELLGTVVVEKHIIGHFIQQFLPDSSSIQMSFDFFGLEKLIGYFSHFHHILAYNLSFTEMFTRVLKQKRLGTP